jgi:hypothetical protein
MTIKTPAFLAVSLAFWAVSSTLISAAPLAKNQIPADSKWLIHLDMNQFADSQTCKLLLANPSEGKRFRTMLQHYQNLLGVDPLKDITSLTLFGNEVTGSRGVALINGSLNPKQITKLFSSYPQYLTKKNGRVTLHSWTDKSTGKAIWASFYSSKQLILSSDEFSLLNTAWVLDGEKPSLGNIKTTPLPFPPPQNGNYFTAVTKGFSGTTPTQAMILRNTQSATMQLGETANIVDGAILLNADSPESATQIQQILNGLLVSAGFADADSPLAKLAELSTISRAGSTISLKIHCPANQAAGLVGSLLSQ